MKVVTRSRLDRALRTAIEDFEVCGLYTDALHEVPVRLTWGHTAYGLCWSTGEIDIPALSGSRAFDIFRGTRVTLTDVVRHEMAHALAHVHLDVVDGPEFEAVFGGRYWAQWDEPPAFDPSDFVSEYATSAPAEDWAETVMVYTRHRGRLDRYRRRMGLAPAFRYVRKLSKRLARAAGERR